MSTSGHDDDEPSPGKQARRGSIGDAGGTAAAAAKRAKKKRVRNFTADDRAAHRIFEKSRREAFKEALTNLAGLLPTLAETEPQRLSKHVVVDESISLIASQREQILSTSEHLRAVKRERDELLVEVNQWRSSAGVELRQPEPSPVPDDSTPAMPQRIKVEATAAAPIAPAPRAADAGPPPGPVSIVGGPGTPFMATALAPDMPQNVPSMRTGSAGSAADMPWQPFESRIGVYGSAPNDGGGPSFGRLDGRAQQEQTVFLPPFDAQQSPPSQASQAYSPVGFAPPAFVQAPMPLQSYMPP